ncbi:hypothetical protein KC347_g12 [Hortaea werneckii]|nr:hypothetical protein KC347_g12 [Hortaea werneckii]
MTSSSSARRILIVLPVHHPESGVHNMAITPATSSSTTTSKAGVVDEFLTVDTRPHRGEGSWAFVSKASYAIGVPPSGIAYPGLTAFTVQRSLSSRDHVLVMASRAALVPPYMASSWKPRAALTLLTLTTLPLRSAGELFRSAILEQHLRSNAGVVDHNVDLEFAGLWVREVVHCPIDNVCRTLLGQLFGLFGRRIRGVVDDQRGALAGKILTLKWRYSPREPPVTMATFPSSTRNPPPPPRLVDAILDEPGRDMIEDGL